ncbi:Panacea domain-containing protein [Methanobrevibacter sp.]|uniref:Panacea domain-containing protein n=1 Tax=Methanobrevibacter sp. TaxID=66852 RepID=UPI00388DAE2F
MNNNIIYNPEKFKSMVHYIISRCEFMDNFGRVVLYKLLYFSDFDNYELYEKAISGETYICKRMGPVPSHFLSAVSQLVEEGKIKESSEVVINYPKYKYSSLKEPDTSLLSGEELQVIDDTINRISHFLSKEISEYSHGDIPWRLANEGEPLNYESVFYRDPEYSVRDYDDLL